MHPQESTGTALRSQFLLNPDLAFLNHGSFGACPRPVFERYQELQRMFEWSPVRYHAREAAKMLEDARKVLAEYVNANYLDLVFTTNATVAVHIVARSLQLGAGDEVLTTDHEYGACDKMWEFLRRKQGFSMVKAELPIPATSQEDIVAKIFEKAGDNTRLLFISHITSPTALTLPIQEICAEARSRGILTLVDGAHSIGQIPLDLQGVNADFYTSNLHKWLCAPKGSAFLYARRELQGLLRPLIVSWGWEAAIPSGSQFIDHHEYRGTRELAAPLTTEAAIAFQREHRWDDVRRSCRELVTMARQELPNLLKASTFSSDSEEWFTQMCAFLLPKELDGYDLQAYLFDQHNVEIPVFDWNGRQTLRISVQGYNNEDDIHRLVDGVKKYMR